MAHISATSASALTPFARFRRNLIILISYQVPLNFQGSEHMTYPDDYFLPHVKCLLNRALTLVASVSLGTNASAHLLPLPNTHPICGRIGCLQC